MGRTTTERRRHGRIEIELPATLARVGGRPLTGPASTVDVSAGGTQLVGPAGFAVADVIRVTITSGDLSVEHQGLIVARRPLDAGRATLHVAFKSLDDRSADDLERMIDLR
jgi:hypothetical protein